MHPWRNEFVFAVAPQPISASATNKWCIINVSSLICRRVVCQKSTLQRTIDFHQIDDIDWSPQYYGWHRTLQQEAEFATVLQWFWNEFAIEVIKGRFTLRPLAWDKLPSWGQGRRPLEYINCGVYISFGTKDLLRGQRICAIWLVKSASLSSGPSP